MPSCYPSKRNNLCSEADVKSENVEHHVVLGLDLSSLDGRSIIANVLSEGFCSGHSVYDSSSLRPFALAGDLEGWVWHPSCKQVEGAEEERTVPHPLKAHQATLHKVRPGSQALRAPMFPPI